jgi:small membrane protein
MIISGLLVLTLLCVSLYAYRVVIRGAMVGILLLFCSMISIFFVFFPEQTFVFANLLGVGRGTDLLLYVCFIIGIILMLLIHVKFQQQSIIMTDLARAIALQEYRNSLATIQMDQKK